MTVVDTVLSLKKAMPWTPPWGSYLPTFGVRLLSLQLVLAAAGMTEFVPLTWPPLPPLPLSGLV